MIESRITRVGLEPKSYASDRDRTQRKFLEARTLYKRKKDKFGQQISNIQDILSREEVKLEEAVDRSSLSRE